MLMKRVTMSGFYKQNSGETRADQGLVGGIAKAPGTELVAWGCGRGVERRRRPRTRQLVETESEQSQGPTEVTVLHQNYLL